MLTTQVRPLKTVLAGLSGLEDMSRLCKSECEELEVLRADHGEAPNSDLIAFLDCELGDPSSPRSWAALPAPSVRPAHTT